MKLAPAQFVPAPGTTLLCVAVFFFAAGAGCSRDKALADASAPARPEVRVTGPVVAGRLENPKIVEASGLAPSRRADGILWVHNDSGHEPAIYAISQEGKHLGTVWPAGADNVDWEDIATFMLGGRSYILIADVGDNRARRKDCGFYVIEEPDPAELSPERELIVSIAWQVPVAYPDGPHDCEAVAVDPGAAPDGSEGKVYLLLKREYPPRLFTVPLKPARVVECGDLSPLLTAGLVTPPLGAPGATQISATAHRGPTSRPVKSGDKSPHSIKDADSEGVIPVQIARLVGKLREIPQPSAVQSLLPIPTGHYRGCPTSMDFSPDGRFAVVLTYGDVLLYPRREGEGWVAALSRKPVILPPHKLGQAEAVCFSRDGKSIFVTEEAPHAKLLRYDLHVK
jgi:hypothetical protein